MVKTDLGRFVELYRSFGIECVVCERHQDDFGRDLPSPQKHIRIGRWQFFMYDEERDTESDKFDGYGGFYSEVIFDTDGKFIKQTFCE